MQLEECTVRRAEAVVEFEAAQNRDDGAHVTNSLAYGLTMLRNMFFTRVHDDVEMEFGTDSMLMPMSGLKSEAKAKAEIEVYQIAVSAEETNKRGFLSNNDDNWCATWLAKLRNGRSLSRDTLRQTT